MNPIRIFISSVPFLFEDAPATDRQADEQQGMMHNLLTGKIRLG
jgi:hypothetical protein